jgi:hypothetical protein
MKLDPARPKGRGPPEPSTTTSNAGFAGVARKQVGNKTTAAASAISVFNAFCSYVLSRFGFALPRRKRF